MIPKRLIDVTAEDIERLVQSGQMEDQTLDYKLELPSRDARGVNALLSDVASFANSFGGDLVYGVDELRDADNQPTGVPKEAVGLVLENVDRQRIWLQQVIYDGLDPSPRVAIQFVEGFANGSILIIRVERALNGPLMIRGNRRFYVRRHSVNVPLERVSDIRDLFIGVESLAQRVRQFRAERLTLLTRGEAPLVLTDQPLLVIHAVPASVALRTLAYGVPELANASQHMPLFGQVAWRPNLDGFLKFFAGGGSPCYVQLFRSGALESVDTDIAADSERFTIAGKYLDRRILQYVDGCRLTLEALGVDLPFYFSVALMNVEKYQLLGPDGFYRLRPQFDRMVVSADIEYAEWPTNAGLAAKPVLDLIWQAAGAMEDPYVKADGSAPGL